MISKIIQKNFKLKLPINIINIGGITNITQIKEDLNNSINFFAYDVGPGNCLIDDWVRNNKDLKFDKDGNYANTNEYSESIKVSVSLLEQLGSDSYIHFYKDIKPVQTEAIEEILADEGEDISVLGDNTKFIARINPNSTVVEGEEIELKIDPSKLHFFDPETGDAL